MYLMFCFSFVFYEYPQVWSCGQVIRNPIFNFSTFMLNFDVLDARDCIVNGKRNYPQPVDSFEKFSTIIVVSAEFSELL